MSPLRNLSRGVGHVIGASGHRRGARPRSGPGSWGRIPALERGATIWPCLCLHSHQSQQRGAAAAPRCARPSVQPLCAPPRRALLPGSGRGCSAVPSGEAALCCQPLPRAALLLAPLGPRQPRSPSAWHPRGALSVPTPGTGGSARIPRSPPAWHGCCQPSLATQRSQFLGFNFWHGGVRGAALC